LPQRSLYKDRNLQLILGITLTAVLGVSSISPAFPSIVKALNISETEVGVLITAFTIPGVILTPFIGVLADRVGRKWVVVPSLFLFGLAGAACALVKDFNVLIVLRVVQGSGAASLATISLVLIGDLFEGERMAAAVGLNASTLNTGLAFYPLIGGALATLGWNYPFLLPLLAIPTALAIIVWLDNPEPKSRENLRQYLGNTWRYIMNIRVASAFVAGVILFLIVYGPYQTYLSLYLDGAFGASSFLIGVILFTMAITSALVASQLGKILRVLSVPRLVELGFLLEAVSLVLIPLWPRVELILISTLVAGLAMGILLPSLMTYLTGVAPAENRAGVLSVNSMMLRLGQTLGPLLFGVVYIYGSFDGVFFWGAALALFTAAVGFIGGKLVR
jgi:ACDE family multidrug resistance protein